MSGAVFFPGTFSTKGCPVFKASFACSHCLYARIDSNNSHFMQPGQHLSLLDIEEVNNWVNNPCAQCHVQEFSLESVHVFSYFRMQRKVCNTVPPALLRLKTFNHSNFIHSIFIIISFTIITIINRSLF